MSSNRWLTYKLGELAEVQNGYAFKSDEFEEKGVPVIKIKNIVTPKIEFSGDTQFYAKEVNGRLKQFLINKGDILISMTGSHLNQIASAVGKIGRYQHEFPALLNQRVGKIYVVNRELLDEDFLFYKLNRFETQVELVGSANQANISRTQIKNLQLFLPELPTQKKIASILSSLDNKIELNRQMNATLEAIAQALFKEWFVDFNYPGATGEMVESELGMIPKGWKVGPVSELCEVNKNTISKRDSFDTVDYIEISEVGRGTIGNVTTYAFGEEPSRAKRKLKHGDVVLSTVRPDRGSYFLALHPRDNLIASTGFGVFSPTTAPYSFLYLLLTDQEKLDYYGHVAHGAAYPAINPSLILEMELAIPSDKLLEQFHRIAEPIFEAMHNNEKENHTLTQLRDSLLPRLMKGEVTT